MVRIGVFCIPLFCINQSTCKLIDLKVEEDATDIKLWLVKLFGFSILGVFRLRRVVHPYYLAPAIT